MNRFTHEFHTHANDIRLTGAERRHIRAKLEAVMRTAPTPSPYFFFTDFAHSRFVMAAIALVIIIGGAGTAYASGAALPGDLLYPVKVSMREPIEGAIAASMGTEARWNAKVAATRLDEARALAEKGDLTASTSAELAANFTAHADAVGSADGQFSSLVTAKSAALLDAANTSGNTGAARASGKLVLAINDHPAEAEPAASPAAFGTFEGFAPAPEPSSPSEKRATPMMMLMSAPADSAPETEDGQNALLASLSVEAQDALIDASSSVAALPDADAKSEASKDRADDLAALIVRAEAERAIGSTTEAVRDFTQALADAAQLQRFIDGATGSREDPVEPTLEPFPI